MKVILSFLQDADEQELVIVQQIIQSRLNSIQKDPVSIGDTVYFRDRKRRKISGTVVKVNSKHVRMKTIFGTITNVPRDKIVVEEAHDQRTREKDDSARNRAT